MNLLSSLLLIGAGSVANAQTYCTPVADFGCTGRISLPMLN
jgi:hypothetical protein